MDELPTFEKVKITCSSSNCEDDKHCYRPRRGQWKDDGVRGECQACGDTSVDMSVTRALDASDPEAIFAQLGRELIRDRFLNAPIDEKGRHEIHKHGVDGLRARVAQHLLSRIGPTPNMWDGRQTPMEGSVLNLAQHATATCCRKCLYYWYGVPRNRPLDDRELDFCENMVLAYLERRKGELRAIETGAANGGDRG
jgi:hypothetical protein